MRQVMRIFCGCLGLIVGLGLMLAVLAAEEELLRRREVAYSMSRPRWG
jgi:hypothetical protein